MVTYTQSSTPVLGTWYDAPLTTTAGWIVHPSGLHATGFGASLISPSTAPPSTHFTIVSISSGLSERSFENSPCAGSANHGGISRFSTLSRIARAHGRASEYWRRGI